MSAEAAEATQTRVEGPEAAESAPWAIPEGAFRPFAKAMIAAARELRADRLAFQARLRSDPSPRPKAREERP